MLAVEDMFDQPSCDLFVFCSYIAISICLNVNVCGQTEFMVDMKCEGCVNSVRNKLETVDGEDL